MAFSKEKEQQIENIINNHIYLNTLPLPEAKVALSLENTCEYLERFVTTGKAADNLASQEENLRKIID